MEQVAVDTPSNDEKYGQYDPVHKKYDDAVQLPELELEVQDLMQQAKPFLKDARVLEFACGSGRYTKELLAAGVHSITAVDLSEKMVQLSRQRINSAQVTFITADCSVPRVFPGGPFDVVIGGWMIDNLDREQLCRAFQNVALNLKTGGRFFSASVPASSDVVKSLQKHADTPIRPVGGSIRYVDRGETDGGRRFTFNYYYNAVLAVKAELFWLTKGVTEACARAAGLTDIVWRDQEQILWAIPNDPVAQRAEYGHRFDMELIAEWRELPYYALLMIRKM